MPLTVDHIRLSPNGDAVIILDQRGLPLHRRYLTLRELPEMCEAIRTLAIRGAPAIGIFAGFAMTVLARNCTMDNRTEFDREFREKAATLYAVRPTAVNLGWALTRMKNVLSGNPELPPAALLEPLRLEAQRILEEDAAMCKAISEHGLALLHSGDGILTHCNAGPIATSLYGTALGPMILGAERGIPLRVYADETRPLLQGARLTAYELSQAGVNVTLICDNMAATVMAQGKVQYCFVGCDRIAANGDTANKIGTSAVAILAKYYGIPFYVLGPSSTIDLHCMTGADIPVEERDPEEIRSMWYAEPMAPPEVNCYNPAFDITDHSLITGMITEHGICREPYTESLSRAANGQQLPQISS